MFQNLKNFLRNTSVQKIQKKIYIIISDMEYTHKNFQNSNTSHLRIAEFILKKKRVFFKLILFIMKLQINKLT